MQKLYYYIALPLIYLLAWTPFPLLYRLSDGLYLLVFYLIGYRKKVVEQNLQRAFPELSDGERRRIRKAYYRHFCDLLLETIKKLSLRPNQLRRRVQFDQPELFQPWLKQQQSLIIVLGHVGNWEWGGARFQLEGLHPLKVLYHPLSHPQFERLVMHMRTRHGYSLISMKHAFRQMLDQRDQLTATAFIADQSPSPQYAYWTTFLHQDTGFFKGPDTLARKLRYPVVYFQILKERRGHYRIIPHLLSADPASEPPNGITEAFARRLEADIRQQPECWLWSHRRWKHERPGEIR